MRFRAGMVKELTFSEFDDYDVILEAIQRDDIDLKFPELTSLHLHVSVAEKSQTFLPIFGASRLRKLEITFQGSNEPLIDTTMETLLAQAHPLRRLEIGATSLPKRAQKYVIQILKATPSINSLSLQLELSHAEDIVEVTTSLPHLRDLVLELNGDDVMRTAYSPGFHSLVSLDIWSPYVLALAIARAITSPIIAEVSMRVPDEGFGPPSNLFEEIATKSTLTSVSLNFYHSAAPQWTDVELLLSCPLISKLDIAIAGPGMELDDGVTSAISRAWPHLTHLRFVGFRSAPKEFTRPSLLGLAELLRKCQKLEEVILEIDAGEGALEAALAKATPASSEPRGKLLLNVRESPITEDSEAAIADYLASLWPGALAIESWWMKEPERGSWDEVGDIIYYGRTNAGTA
ncbi:hypothetical protein FS837_007555 [Tulasnella sp. UAMH 9824]|nr:hypothetical protein FS837_007555 [Tulasnella sp. UAMH 9824]